MTEVKPQQVAWEALSVYMTAKARMKDNLIYIILLPDHCESHICLGFSSIHANMASSAFCQRVSNWVLLQTQAPFCSLEKKKVLWKSGVNFSDLPVNSAMITPYCHHAPC